MILSILHIMGGKSQRKRECRDLNDGYRGEYDSFLRRVKDAVWSVDDSRVDEKRGPVGEARLPITTSGRSSRFSSSRSTSAAPTGGWNPT